MLSDVFSDAENCTPRVEIKKFAVRKQEAFVSEITGKKKKISCVQKIIYKITLDTGFP